MNYGTLATQLVDHKDFGKMAAIQNGVYTTVPVELVSSGKRQVDVDKYYDKENYRPKFKDIENLPMFLA